MGSGSRSTRYDFILAISMFAATVAVAQNPSPDALAEQRVNALLAQMTLEEKIDLFGGVNSFDVRGVPRLGVPVMAMADGPFGIRRYSRANVMMGGIGLAATWNPALAQTVGVEIGRDARARGVHFYLAPGVNIYRSPLNGRNFEYLGEDPYLASRIAVALIEGVQSRGVAATVKHFLGNNSEFARHVSDSVIDERTLREIYLPVFEAAVKEANVAAVMSSYNRVNGEHPTQSRRLLTDLLKREWGFTGVLMSDWDATYDALGAANAGLDLEMPAGRYLNRAQLLPLIRSGRVSQATLDDKVRRILRTAVRFGWLEGPQVDAGIPRYNPQGRAAALQTAREGMVLLKNEGNVLPLQRRKVRRIALIGPNAYPAVPHGGGSATVAPFHAVSFLEGLTTHLGTDVTVDYLRGLPDLGQVASATPFTRSAEPGAAGVKVEVFDNAELVGVPIETRYEPSLHQGAPLDFRPLATGEGGLPPARSRLMATRWTGYYTPVAAGDHDLFVQLGGFSRVFGYRLYVDDRLVADRWHFKPAAIDLQRLTLTRQPHKIVLEHRARTGGLDGDVPFVRLGIVRAGHWVDAAVEPAAASADAVVLAVGFDSTSEAEDWDRSFGLPPGQDELIRKVTAANRSAIVVITSGGAVDMNGWLGHTPAVLQAWYAGQEGGTALAEILFGAVNPSGHLPATFERRWQDNPAHDSYYPKRGSNQVVYREGVFVGYRGYEQQGIQPQFPFGHGLSYTEFEYGDLQIAAAADAGRYQVSFTVTNTGERAGAAVAQVYVAPPPAQAEASRVPRPPKELKGFAKVTLAPGEKRQVSVPLDARAFAYYDVKRRRWHVAAGTYGVLVGSSSAAIQLRGQVQLHSSGAPQVAQGRMESTPLTAPGRTF